MLSGGDSFDNTEPAARKGLGSKAASGWFAYKMLSVDFIEDLEVCHICQEAGRFNDIHHGQSGSFQNGFNIFAGLFCLSGNAGSFPVWGSIPSSPAVNTNPLASYAWE